MKYQVCISKEFVYLISSFVRVLVNSVAFKVENV